MSEQIQIKIKCQKCHEVLAPEASFCHSCGLKQGGVSVCASCNTSLESDWSVCPNCGKALNEAKRRELEAEQQREATYTDSSTGMQFVWVPGGCYMMGDVLNDKDAFEDERPAHEVCVDGFWMGKYQVTQKQWTEVMGNNPSHFSSCGDNRPVESVGWNDVQEFIRKLNSQSGRSYRLPTEAEWEYAARSGGKQEKYSGGDNVDAVAWYEGNSGGKTHRVGTKQPNGLGIYDMSGNVWEWVAIGTATMGVVNSAIRRGHLWAPAASIAAAVGATSRGSRGRPTVTTTPRTTATTSSASVSSSPQFSEPSHAGRGRQRKGGTEWNPGACLHRAGGEGFCMNAERLVIVAENV